MKKSQELSYFGPRAKPRPAMSAEDVQHFVQLQNLGIRFDPSALAAMTAFAMDGNDVGISPIPGAGVTSPSIATQIQFLQNWLPGFVRTITATRKIDDLIGLSTSGAWEDEEIVQGVLEPIGNSVPYTDYGNVPLASWNANFERRTVVRFEQGISIGKLEELRAGRMRIDSGSEKRSAAALSLDIQRNRIGFYGYNNGANRTYGFLNEPSLPAYVSVPAGTGGTKWRDKTFLEICDDMRTALSALRINSKGVIDPTKAAITFALPTGAVDFLSTVSDFGISVRDWLRGAYPNVRIESAPELDDANGGASVMYVYAESVEDGASDDSRTWAQVVPSKFFALGVEQRAKGYLEDYSNATAGVLLKRPYAVVRFTGV